MENEAYEVSDLLFVNTTMLPKSFFRLFLPVAVRYKLQLVIWRSSIISNGDPYRVLQTLEVTDTHLPGHCHSCNTETSTDIFSAGGHQSYKYVRGSDCGVTMATHSTHCFFRPSVAKMRSTSVLSHVGNETNSPNLLVGDTQ